MKNLQSRMNISLGVFRHRTLLFFFGAMLVFYLTVGSENAEGKSEVMPSEEQLEQLVNATLLDFAVAIKAMDFTGFYNNIAEFWQKQTTKEELSNAFKTFSDQNIDLTGLQGLNPLFTQEPYLDKNDWLILQGYYPTQPSIVYFTLKYLYEKPEWKLIGINVNVKEGSIPGRKPETIPPLDQLQRLVNATLLDFAVAIKARDFTGFYHKIAKLWQAQTTPEELTTGFKSFSDQNIDLTVLQGLDPVFTEEPFLNDNGWLVLQGHYPTQPSITYFTLEYLYEESEWKLGVIDINVTKDSPPEEHLKSMVNVTMLDFAGAVNARDFSDFYQNIAKLWQDQTTPEELADIFKSFADQNIDLSVLQGLDPVFTQEPSFNEEEWLILQGQYPTQPSIVYFTLTYLFEAPKWRLVGININIE